MFAIGNKFMIYKECKKRSVEMITQIDIVKKLTQ